MTHISESAMQGSGNLPQDGGYDHPAGQISFGIGGGLSMRSRLLSASEGEAGNTIDLPWTTMIPL
ncbi:hypothetical protein [Streptomyces sp. 196(2019)]|uniref:hypothetical protein n=1 Tax=Streptomyces sp. 196(2019) TaxID=2683820 RepID=UPI0013EA8975|nr:hypothetical protein [Streptomyces sp. 196(2019)]NGO85025.1 hypothetical protein [Streptomyces sp. 196(2019)]